MKSTSYQVTPETDALSLSDADSLWMNSEPLLAIAGNCVIIDHGNAEFSALMHLQHGSVTVEVGSTVRQGQVIARLGNSGHAFGAHLHYQLQDGPALFRANSLPVKFDNLEGVELARGVYFEPR